MDDDAIKEMIQRHEGFRDEIYEDTVGVLTIGWGHALHEGSKFPEEACQLLFDMDFEIIQEDYDKLDLPELDGVRRGVIMDMLFNLGLPRLKQFKNMLAAIEDADYERAADEMLDSRWANQVGNRATELSEMMRTGEVQ